MELTIDTLTAGQDVELYFAGELGNDPYCEVAKFIGCSGEADTRRATFETYVPYDGTTYQWYAYIHEGHWVCGTNAEQLSIS